MSFGTRCLLCLSSIDLMTSWMEVKKERNADLPTHIIPCVNVMTDASLCIVRVVVQLARNDGVQDLVSWVLAISTTIVSAEASQSSTRLIRCHCHPVAGQTPWRGLLCCIVLLHTRADLVRRGGGYGLQNQIRLGHFGRI